MLVLETCSGLVTGAVAERLGGFGHVCTTYLGDRCPPLEATRMLNFSDSIKQSMSTAPLATLLRYQAEPAVDEAHRGSEATDQAAAPAGQPERQHKGQPDEQLSVQSTEPTEGREGQHRDVEMSEAASLQNQQIARMNGTCMRGLLDANSEQPQTAVLAELGSNAQAQVQEQAGVPYLPLPISS